MQERIYADEDGARKEEIALLKGLDEHGFRYVKSSSALLLLHMLPFNSTSKHGAPCIHLDGAMCGCSAFYERMKEVREYHRRYPLLEVAEVRPAPSATIACPKGNSFISKDRNSHFFSCASAPVSKMHSPLSRAGYLSCGILNMHSWVHTGTKRG